VRRVAALQERHAAKSGYATEKKRGSVRRGEQRPQSKKAAGLRPALHALGGVTVGGNPFAAGAAIVDYIERVERAEGAAVVAEFCDGVADRFEAGREVAGANGFADEAGPEAGERFVVAAGFGVGGADGFVVVDDAGAGEFERAAGRMIVGQAGGYGDVSGMGPGRFGQSAGLPSAEEIIEGVVAFEERMSVIFGRAARFDHWNVVTPQNKCYATEILDAKCDSNRGFGSKLKAIPRYN